MVRCARPRTFARCSSQHTNGLGWYAVHIDSSAIIDSVVSSYQRTLLDLIFLGDAASRDKVHVRTARREGFRHEPSHYFHNCFR